MADGTIIIDTQVDSRGAEKGVSGLGSKLGSAAKTGLKVFTGALTVASVAVASLTKMAISSYAEYEQLVGGVETLFKKSSGQVIKYADDAYKTAGMSANEYMKTVTGFSASLLQGLGGDTKKAAEIGNMAVTDMADNANKMGTAIGSIQDAYQGFAKQNYTMLDNLKLGYGGTKTEMQRLLVDAEKLTGIKYDINNFSDVIEAIHAVQAEMGITGTTAKEAASTIEGSLNMTKAAWGNLLTGMADDGANFDTLVNNFVDSVSTLGQNLLPRIEIAINGVGNLINKLLPPIFNKLPELITSILPGMINAGLNVVSSLVTGIQSNLPQIATSAIQIIQSLVAGFITLLPQILELGLKLIIELGRGIAQAIPQLLPQIINVVIAIADVIIQNLPLLIQVGLQIIVALAQGIADNLPTLIENIPRIINSFCEALFGQLPQIIVAGVKIILALIKGLIQSIPTLIANIPAIIMAIVNVVSLYNWIGLGKSVITKMGNGISAMKGNIGNIARNVAEWVGTCIKNIFTGGLSWGKNLISSIGQGISSMVGFLSNSARTVATNALTAIKTKFSGAADIGKNLIRGIWNGINNMKGWILSKIGGFAGSIISGIKGAFGIHSPSRVMRDLIGVNLVKGIGVGVDIETPKLTKDIVDNMDNITSKMTAAVYQERARTSRAMTSGFNKTTSNTVTNNNDNGVTQNVTIVNPERTPSENARALKKVGRDLGFGY